MKASEIKTLKKAVEILDAEFCRLEDEGYTFDDYYTDMVGEALAALSEVVDQLRTR